MSVDDSWLDGYWEDRIGGGDAFEEFDEVYDDEDNEEEQE